MNKVTKYVDGYVLALFGMVVVACLFPAKGSFVAPTEWATNIAIGLLFFLYGARLSRDETVEGIKHWRLHLLILGLTFVLFPIFGLALKAVTSTFLPATLVAGILYLTLLPSTVQSSVTFTSMARGNVAGSICAASFSNMFGVVITPILVVLLMGQSAHFSLDSAERLMIQLLLPFIVGQFFHSRLAGFLMRNRAWLTYLDRLGIMLVVYSAFSEGMREDMWGQVSVLQVIELLLICAVLLAAVMWISLFAAKRMGFDRGDQITTVFCGSKKSMASGLPMAAVLFAGGNLGLLVLPLMLFHQFQLIVCAQIARMWPGGEDDAGELASEGAAA